MRHTFFLCAFFIISIVGVNAQTDSSFTLKQCIDYALENATAVKNAQLDEYIANAKVGEIRALGLPQVTGAGQMIDNPNLKKSFFPTKSPFFSAPSGGGSSTTTIVPLEANSDFLVINNTFQLRNTADFNVSANQLLFNGTYLLGLKASKAYKELAQKAITQNKIQTTSNIIKAYYLVLINKSRIQLLDANVARLDSLFQQTKLMNQNGLAEKIDMDRIEVSYQNILVERMKFQNLMGLSYILLKFQMGMPVDTQLEIKGTIEDLNKEIAKPTESEVNVENRIEYSLMQTQKRLNVLDVKSVNSGYLPILSAFGTVGVFRSANNFQRLANGRYYDYNFWGLNLSVPIFDGFSKHYKAQQAKLNVQKTDNNLNLLKNSIKTEFEQSSITMKNNIETMNILKKNMDLSFEVARITKIKYQEGVGTNIEVINAESSYKEAVTNYFNSLYDVLVSKVDYQKSLGLLTNE